LVIHNFLEAMLIKLPIYYETVHALVESIYVKFYIAIPSIEATFQIQPIFFSRNSTQTSNILKHENVYKVFYGLIWDQKENKKHIPT
jgi:hypothetical protein